MISIKHKFAVGDILVYTGDHVNDRYMSISIGIGESIMLTSSELAERGGYLIWNTDKPHFGTWTPDFLRSNFTYSRNIYKSEDLENVEEIEDTDRYKTTSGKQLFDVLRDDLLTPEEYKGFLRGNVYKYVKRYEDKNGVEDLRKAIVYIEKLIELEEEK